MFAQDALYDDKMDYFVKNNQKSKIDCKACKKPFISILQHLKKSKNCGSTYTQEEMDSLNRISKEISRQKLSDTQIRYYGRNKGKIGERSAKNYLENKGKKYEVGIGQGIVKALHDDDIQKHDAVKEWVEIFKKETVKHHARTSMDNLKHIEQTFKYPSTGDYFTKRKKMIPLKIDYPVARIPSVVKLLKFLELTPPSRDHGTMRPWDDPKQNWTYPYDWHDPRKDDLVTIVKMKRRFIKEIIASWDQTDSDRGEDQWLDPIDCKGCKYSFKRLLKHLDSSSKCQPFYSESEIEILHQQKWDKIESKKEIVRGRKAHEKINKRFQTSVANWEIPTDRKPMYNIQSKYNEDIVPEYLMPFAKKKAKVDPSKKQPIKVMKVKVDDENL